MSPETSRVELKRLINEKFVEFVGCLRRFTDENIYNLNKILPTVMFQTNLQNINIEGE